jgi:cobalt-zinc-cadmium efflux system outer membrane protein
MIALTIDAKRTRAFALVIVALSQAVPLKGQSATTRDTVRLTLADAQRLSLERSPSFLADREARAIAQGDAVQARVFAPNPRLELESPGAATSGFGRYEAALSQEIEWAGQRGLRIDAAESGLRRAMHSVRDAARHAVAATSEAYYGAVAAERALGVAEEILDSNERLLAAIQIQLREGEISALEASLASIEVARGRARVLAARRAARSAQLALSRSIGVTPNTWIEFSDSLPEPLDATQLQPDSLVRVAMARRPDLAAREAAVEELGRAARLARREAVPNLELRALAESENSFGETRFGIGFGLPVPLWNRNQGTASRAGAEARQAAWSRDAAALQVQSEVTDAYQAYVTASAEAEIFERDVLGPVRANQLLLEVAYREGKIDLTALLLLRNQLLDAQLSYWDTWFAHRRSLVALQSATASIGMGLNEIDTDFEPR